MAITAPCDEERAEVEVVLQSGIFVRARNLESFFRYVCECHLRGQADELKEYNIAVEAFGRAPQFDQKKDSIVRVEAHRLRKRLAEYYVGPGAGHRIHISIPRGTYAPQFVAAVASADNQPDTNTIVSINELPPPFQSESLVAPPVPIPPRAPSFRLRWPVWILVLASVLGVAAWRLQSVRAARAQSSDEVWRSVPGDLVPAEFRMLAGYHGKPFVDVQGHEWRSDAYYSGGHSIPLRKGSVIQGLTESSLITSARTGRFHYDIPVTEGVYEIHLHFIETEFGFGNPGGGGDSSRLFRLAINGRNQIDLFDVHAQAGGPNRLLVRVFKDIYRATDGKIHFAFDPLRSTALLNAIEILPSAAGRIRPIRIVAQEHPVTDSDGQVWSADEYVVGGTMVPRINAHFQDRNFALYQGERYGNFSYYIPVAPGKYRVTLHFAETWFGTPSASISSNEHRLFEVYANGVALMRNFDVLSEAGAANRGVEKVFEGLEPNAQGELALQFLPLANYAEINAIEVVETE